jgi:cytoskeletal protein RodZ
MASERPSGGFGGRLRDARERRGLTLQQIARATKISIGTLGALERNDFARLPGGIFSRAFVRSYASQVGLDPETMVREFVSQLPGGQGALAQRMSEHNEADELHESHQRMATVLARLVTVSVPIVAVVLYFGVAGRSPSEREPEPLSTIAPTTGVGSFETRIESAAGVGYTAPPAGSLGRVPSAMTIAIVATRPSWISLVVDGELVVDREFRPGDSQTLDVRRDLVLTTADAGAIDLILNGDAAKPLGPPGESVTVRMTPANFRDYVAVR